MRRDRARSVSGPGTGVRRALRTVRPLHLALTALVLAPAMPPTGASAGPATARAQEWPTAASLDVSPDSLEKLQEAHDLLHDPVGHVRAFASDGWAILGAPFRVRGKSAWQLAGVLGAFGILFAFDEPISDAVVEDAESGVGHKVEEVGEFFDPIALMGNTNIFWFGGMVASDLLGRERFEVMFKELLWSHWLASATRKGIGLPIGRERPETGAGPYEFTDGSSFPSGHASTITQVAAVLSHHIDRWPATVLLYGMAGTVVYQRVSSEKHWASDSWLGAAWGWGVAQVIIRRRETFRDDFVPFFEPETNMLGVRIPVRF